MTDLSTLSLSALCALYNEHAEKPINKFACSKEAAIAKVQSVLPKAPKTKKPGPKQGIGAMVCELILQGTLKPQEILAKVLESFPTAKTTMKCIYWYYSHLKSTGELSN